ncbi:MAG: hypothetical protein D6706_05645 [Chloroflexi bacterium]|nr:MAG: hypothetical protein D6706_05645 [Chloroflexota bacterium]
MDYTTLLKAAAPFLANIVGWLQTATADGKIEKYEWVKLAKSLLRQSAIALFGVTTLQGVGIDIDVFSGAAGAALVETIYLYLAKLKTKKK